MPTDYPPATLSRPPLVEALEKLRAAGVVADRQGMHWLIRRPGEDAGVLTEAEVIALTSDFPVVADLSPGSSPAPTPPAVPDNALPLLSLISALETHAAQLPSPLPRDHRIPLPAGLPERLSAPLDLVVAGRYQPRTRFDQIKLDELAASIQEHGILTALKAFANERGCLELIAGERRLRAARQAGLAFVPIELCSYTLRQIDEISTIDNLQRDDLTPIEEGTAYERMIREWQISEAELARRLGKNRAYIQQRRAIADAAPEVIEALDKEQITFSQARAIAQAAPGQAKAQKAALTKIAELTKQGKRTTEAEARAAAEKAVLATAKKDLTALGWTISEPYGYFLVWAPSERPKQWTGAEMLEAIQAQRRPTGQRPAELTGAKKGDTLLPTIKLRYRIENDYAPWVGLAEDWGQHPTFYAAAELDAVAEQIKADYAAMQERAVAAGWTIEADTSGGYSQASFKFRSQQGAQQSIWGWPEAEKTLGLIEAGKVKAEPQPQRGYEPTVYTCEACTKKTTSYNHFEGRRLCDECHKTASKAAAARKAATRATIAGHIGAWLAQAPDAALQLLLDAAPGSGGDTLLGDRYMEPREQTRRIRLASREQLCTALIDRLAATADKHRDHPVCELLGALPIDDESAAAGDANPLLDLSERLSQIEAWIAQHADAAPSLDVIQLQRATLEDIGDDLDGYADDESIADAAFEDLAHRIGAATAALINLAETGAAPQLAEVEA
jgi:ParB/RepB/Spo0J family partition protein